MNELPSVDALLREVAGFAELGHDVARWIARRAVHEARERVRTGAPAGDVRADAERAARALTGRRLQPVINATGVLLHTNLGRAPLPAAAVDAAIAASGTATLEFDAASGERGARAPVAATLAAALCDAEDALIVNNNAAALLLALAALARGREAIVGRGELIEIGGEFRLPDVMEASGAILREVGTTNRTRARDYARAAGEQTALILKVHPSNYRVVGFHEAPSVGELATIAREAGVPLMFDTGSGLLHAVPGLDEPDASTALRDGADLVCFSGDKLLGGPQAGVLAGRADLIEKCRRHPIARAVRTDKLTLAAMEATLWAHARGEQTPVERMRTADLEDVRARAKQIVAAAETGEVIDGVSVIGGGALPGHEIPTALIALDGAHHAARLRAFTPPIVARVERTRTVLDVRTIDPSQDAFVVEALRA